MTISTLIPTSKLQAVDPFAHYLDTGRDEGRQPDRRIRRLIEPHFDGEHYLTQNPALGRLSPIEHFIAFGWRQGLDPSPNLFGFHLFAPVPGPEKSERKPVSALCHDGPV